MTLAIRADLARQIALASRALAVAGLFDMNGHISIRDGEVAYVNSRRASRIAVRADEVAVVRIADGKIIEGEPPSETPLHLGVYRARADAGSVAHFHPLYATAFAIAGRPLVTATNAGTPFGEVVPVYDDPALIHDDEQARAMAKALGDRRAVLLRGHGVVVAAEDLPSCVAASFMLEESARRLHAAAALGAPRAFTAAEIARVRAQLWKRAVIEKTWTDAVERARLAGALADLDAAAP